MPRAADSSKQDVQVLLDCREPKSYLTACQSLIPTANVKMLETGDYVIITPTASLGMERKKVGDFLSSLRSGRLEAQATRMTEEFDIRILLLEGVWDVRGNQVGYRGHNTGWHVASYQMAVYAFCQKFGMMPLWVPNVNGVALTVRAFYRRAITKGLVPGKIISWQQEADLVTEDLVATSDSVPATRAVARHVRNRSLSARRLAWAEAISRIVGDPQGVGE